jgi:hypothetical protein
MLITHKICRSCRLRKPIEQFHHNRFYQDGYERQCKACRNTRRTNSELAAKLFITKLRMQPIEKGDKRQLLPVDPAFAESVAFVIGQFAEMGCKRQK